MNKIATPDGWNSVRLSDIAVKCNEKNSSFAHSLVLTNSAQRGIIPQVEHFDKDIAVDENIDGYFIVNDGDFVYNPRISSTAPCGPIRRNHLGETGVVSPLYTVFKLKDDINDKTYLEYFFLSSSWYRYMNSIANYGARHDRMSITDKGFFAMPIPLPPLDEQHAIADILTTADKLIATKERLIASKKKQKRWLMQNLLTGKIRLPGFCGEWENIQLDDVVCEYTEKTTVNNQYPILTSARRGLMLQTEYYTDNQITTDDNIGYNILPYGYITYRSRSDDGVFVFNENKLIEKGIISYYYPVFTVNENASHNFILALLNYSICRLAYSLIEGTAQQVLSFNKLKTFQLFVPPLPEQNAIADVLTTADREIELLTRNIERHKLQKKYLMQQLLTGKIRV